MYLLIDASNKVQLDNFSKFNNSISYKIEEGTDIYFSGGMGGRAGIRCKRDMYSDWWVYKEAAKELTKVLL